MPPKLKKALLLGLAALLLAVGGQGEWMLNREREVLGISRFTDLKGAPPMLALTTVALGGFRGLISNLLWMRATDLQDEGKYFEMVQLADWITKLEPHFPHVWLVQSWNMAYNISVKFKDYPDRWRWVQRGIELLRDDGLRYNPHDVLIHRELAWFFQHKMGADMDDAHIYYKLHWALDMNEVFGTNSPAGGTGLPLFQSIGTSSMPWATRNGVGGWSASAPFMKSRKMGAATVAPCSSSPLGFLPRVRGSSKPT